QEAERRDIRMDSALATAPAAGDPALAESLMANLVGNAIRHNLDGGRVEISTAKSDGLAVVTVSNTGPLIPAGEVDRLFQPFQRLGTQRVRHASGHGLGLAIVSAIVSVHGAALTPEARPEGGLAITVSFPSQSPQAPGRRLVVPAAQDPPGGAGEEDGVRGEQRIAEICQHLPASP
ncbi:MAG: sensor histidine kinase, partial [Streptosporangiaceae bacterium]